MIQSEKILAVRDISERERLVNRERERQTETERERERERDSHTINCVHENQKQLGGNINRHAQPSTQEWPLQTSRLTSSFAPISNAASMRGRKKSPSQNQPSNNNRRTPNEGDTI